MTNNSNNVCNCVLILLVITLHCQPVSYLVRSMTVLHQTRVIAAVLAVQIRNLEETIDLQGHPGRGFDQLVHPLPNDRRLRLANTLTWQCDGLLPRHNEHLAERINSCSYCKHEAH